MSDSDTDPMTLLKTGDRMMFGSKKGLSPLIAAVLLLVVVAGIGAIVTGMVREKVSEDSDQIDAMSVDVTCSSQVVFDVPKMGSDYMICMGTGYVNVTLENTGTEFIDEFQLKVFGSEGVVQNDSFLTAGLGSGQVASYEVVYYDTSVGEVIEFFIVPKKKVPGTTSKVFCHESQMKFADIDNC